MVNESEPTIEVYPDNPVKTLEAYLHTEDPLERMLIAREYVRQSTATLTTIYALANVNDFINTQEQVKEIFSRDKHLDETEKPRASHTVALQEFVRNNEIFAYCRQVGAGAKKKFEDVLKHPQEYRNQWDEELAAALGIKNSYESSPHIKQVIRTFGNLASTYRAFFISREKDNDEKYEKLRQKLLNQGQSFYVQGEGKDAFLVMIETAIEKMDKKAIVLALAHEEAHLLQEQHPEEISDDLGEQGRLFGEFHALMEQLYTFAQMDESERSDIALTHLLDYTQATEVPPEVTAFTAKIPNTNMSAIYKDHIVNTVLGLAYSHALHQLRDTTRLKELDEDLKAGMDPIQALKKMADFKVKSTDLLDLNSFETTQEKTH